jgi:large subunit ribosomal protein L23
MGLLDRFTKRKQEKQLEAQGAPSVDPKKEVEKATKPEKKEEKKQKTVEKKPAPQTEKNGFSEAHRILMRPVVSEKAATHEAHGTYTFEVDPKTTKIEVKKAVRQLYGVLPTKVRVLNMEGKRVRFGRQLGKRKDWKKAIVTLPKGKTINIHEGV